MVVGVLVLAVAGGGFALYRALRHVPAGYEQALAVAPEVRATASEEMFQRVTSLTSDVRKPGTWQALFTADQINGWLAVGVPKNHPEAIPPEVRDPRVIIDAHEVTVAFRWVQEDWETVVSLTVEPYVPAPNTLALRFRKARAGAVPLPLAKVLEQVPQVAQRLNLGVQWRQADGDPVALLSFPSPRDGEKKAVQFDTLRLGPGELFVSGTTIRRP